MSFSLWGKKQKVCEFSGLFLTCWGSIFSILTVTHCFSTGFISWFNPGKVRLFLAQQHQHYCFCGSRIESKMCSFLLGFLLLKKRFLCCHKTKTKTAQTCQQWLDSQRWWWRACQPAALEIWPLWLWRKAAKCLWRLEKQTHFITRNVETSESSSVRGKWCAFLVTSTPNQTWNSSLFFSPSGHWVSISDSGLSMWEEEPDVDSHSSLSDSVISPSSGSLFPSESSLRVDVFFFFRFFDLLFFFFFFALLLSSQCEPFFCFFLFDTDFSLSSRSLEDFLCDGASGLRERRFSFRDSVVRLVVCSSTTSVSSSFIFTSSTRCSCHQIVINEKTNATDVYWQPARWLCSSQNSLLWLALCFCACFSLFKGNSPVTSIKLHGNRQWRNDIFEFWFKCRRQNLSKMCHRTPCRVNEHR